MTTLSRDIMAVGRVASVEPNGAKATIVVRFADQNGPVFLVQRSLHRLVKPGAAVCIEGYLRGEGVVFAKSVTPLGEGAE